MIKHLILLSATMCLLSCNYVPTNVDLSSYLATQPSKPGVQQRATNSRHQLGVNPQGDQRTRQLQIARHLEQNGNHQAAIARYVQLTEAFPNDSDTLHHLAILQDKHGDPSKSARNYLRALQLAPTNAELLCDYGYSRYIQGDVVQAEALLLRAVEIDANLRRGYNNLGLVLAAQGRNQEALTAFERTGLPFHEAQENLRQARVAGLLSSSQRPIRLASRPSS